MKIVMEIKGHIDISDFANFDNPRQRISFYNQRQTLKV